MGQFFAWTVAPRAVRIVLSNSSGLKSAAVTRLLPDRGADVVFDDGAVPSWIDRDDARSADVVGIACRRAGEPDPDRANANRQRAAQRQSERRATRRQL